MCWEQPWHTVSTAQMKFLSIILCHFWNLKNQYALLILPHFLKEIKCGKNLDQYINPPPLIKNFYGLKYFQIHNFKFLERWYNALSILYKIVRKVFNQTHWLWHRAGEVLLLNKLWRNYNFRAFKLRNVTKGSWIYIIKC